MELQAITLSIEPDAWTAQAPLNTDTASAQTPCAYCGASAGQWTVRCSPARKAETETAVTSHAACPLCALPHHLERSHIDEEAALVWLPEMSQQAINAIMREVHIQIRVLGEDLHAGSIFRGRSSPHRTLHYVRAVLAERAPAASRRVGTSSPHELGLALLELSAPAYAKRAPLLGGLRLMPLGRFHDGEQDVYPRIVDAWRQPTEAPPSTAQQARRRWPFAKG